MPRCLIVDDDPEIRSLVVSYLERFGLPSLGVGDGAAMRRALEQEAFDAVVLDLMLPDEDGLALCQWLRSHSSIPVIMLTARGDPMSRVLGLELGADDYLAKPFEFDELLARMRAVGRRRSGRAQTQLRHGDLVLDPATRQVQLAGAPVLLSAREFAVLEALMQRPGALLSRAQLEDRLYGWGDAVESNAVPVYIHQLRRKLGEGRIGTVRGVGYFLAEPGA